MPIINSSSNTPLPYVQSPHAKVQPSAHRQLLHDAAALATENGPPKRTQSPDQGRPAPRADLPSGDRRQQFKSDVTQRSQTAPVGEPAIHQTKHSHTMEPLPDPNNPGQIFKFAMGFDAYKACGSFDAAARIAKEARRSTLEEVRVELFFKARASRHSGNDAYVETFKEVLPLLERFSNAGPA